MESKKKCSKCGEEKELSEFWKSKSGKFGVQNTCIACDKKQKKKYNSDNKEIISEKAKIRNSKPEEKLKKQEYNLKNKDKRDEWRKNYYEENYNKILAHNNEYTRNRWAKDPIWRMKKMFRVRFHTILKKNKIKFDDASCMEYVGCSFKEFKDHIENQFLPEMNWNNHGEVWEIDHIIPIASFDFNFKEQIEQCFHYSNHQPLFKTTEIAESFGYENYIGNKNKLNRI